MTSRPLPHSPPAGPYSPAPPGARDALALFRIGEEHARAGLLRAALESYAAAAAAAADQGEHRVLIDALRRTGVAHYNCHAHDEARTMFQQSHDAALAHGEPLLAAEALNALGVLEMMHGAHATTRALFHDALRLGGSDPALRGRIEQNLGVTANIRGDLPGALGHYERALAAYRSAGDERSCAGLYVNLGMVSADRERWDDADRYFRLCLESAAAADDVRLRAIALMNRTEVFIARQQFEPAREHAEAALVIFDQIGEKKHKSETYKILGVVYRETGRPALAEARLQTAVALAGEAGAMLEEAEASRELALLYQQLNRNQDALRLLTTAHRLFRRLDARRDMIDVGGKVLSLEGTYLEVVRRWGQSIESADSYTHGHSERVATYAVAVARQLGLAEDELTTIRVGAYLHDVGKVRVPLEILNKPGRLTDDELAVIRQHPVYGVELLAGIEFPWDIKPIIRWHHEKHDGTGYPDRLRADEIPLHAQIICVADVFDALTSTRSYRPALPRERALEIMREERASWRADVFAAFEAAVARG